MKVDWLAAKVDEKREATESLYWQQSIGQIDELDKNVRQRFSLIGQVALPGKRLAAI